MITLDQIWIARKLYRQGSHTPVELSEMFKCTPREAWWAIRLDAKRLDTWLNLRREYLTSDISILDLSRKYGIAQSEAWKIATDNGGKKRER